MAPKLKAMVQARWFDRTILLIIIAAGVLAGLETNPTMVARHGMWLKRLDWLVLTIFIIELVLKLAAYGRQPWRYFHEGWNVFDFTIVVLCCLPMDSQFAAVLRLARGLRLLRLVTALPRLQLLVGALLKSLSAMGYVTLLLALVFYIYGVAGVHLFGQAAPAAFGSLATTWLTLFQVITLDNWSDLLASAQRGAPAAALVYFVSFILLGTMIMMNLFIGIIMNSMSEMHAEIEQRNHLKQPGHTTLADEVNLLEEQLEALKSQTKKLKLRLTEESDRKQ